jgi:hypothetical protein
LIGSDGLLWLGVVDCGLFSFVPGWYGSESWLILGLCCLMIGVFFLGWGCSYPVYLHDAG